MRCLKRQLSNVVYCHLESSLKLDRASDQTFYVVKPPAPPSSRRRILGVVAPTVDYPIDTFDKVIAVNLRGVFLGLRFVLPVMIGQHAGSIINTSSMGGAGGVPGSNAYNASKHGVIGLTKTAAIEVGRPACA